MGVSEGACPVVAVIVDHERTDTHVGKSEQNGIEAAEDDVREELPRCPPEASTTPTASGRCSTCRTQSMRVGDVPHVAVLSHGIVAPGRDSGPAVF